MLDCRPIAISGLVRRKELRFAIFFLLLFAVLRFCYFQERATIVEEVVVNELTVKPSAWVINALSSEEYVMRVGHRLVSPHLRLSVLNGREGTESMFLLVAAILAFAARWRDRLAGAALGFLLIYCLNELRIVALYFSRRHDPELFGLIHGYMGPALIVAIACLCFLWWAGRLPTYHASRSHD